MSFIQKQLALIRTLQAERDIDKARIARLEAAIRKHRDNFPDEALEGERELWKTLEEGK